MARPTTPRLSPDRIRDTALEIIDEHGLAALSMRLLADTLSVRPSSLYGHFSTKDDVLDAVANRVISGVDTGGFERGWRTGLETWARSYLAVLAEHPNCVPLIASGTQRREQFLEMANVVHGGLVGAGWPARRATEISGAVKYLVIGAASTPFASGFADDVQVYLDRYPHLRQAHRLSDDASRIDHDSFELGLTALVRGLEPGPSQPTPKYVDSTEGPTGST